MSAIYTSELPPPLWAEPLLARGGVSLQALALLEGRK